MLWTQLLCSLAIVTKTAFFSEKQVDEWSFVIFSAYIFFGVVIGSYTILWGIQTFLKHDTVETTILKWVTTLCTTASILVFMLIFNYNKIVLQHSEVDFDFKIASFFLYNGHLFFGVVLYVDHPFQPVNEFLDVPGYKLIALLWIHFIKLGRVNLAL
ncbi:hypothetical protein Ocin01_09979 [Orchesella cincta]|uniref:Uncharacterized protein n=1 Tax=Orchesella cincta TaxID=48709 RepID=A0A1D2MUM2_ORCCI|nr:hypothetical protein Ocin01_09979 [Orchesella cincta]